MKLICLLLLVPALAMQALVSGRGDGQQPAPGKASKPSDADIARMMIIDAPHPREYLTEDAATLRAFGPGTDYGPIMTNGVEDPFFAGGGFLFAPTGQKKLKIYAIAVDFTDAAGDLQIPYGRHKNVIKSAYGGSIFDYSDPQIHFEQQFLGTEGLKANPKFTWKGASAHGAKGIKQMLEEQSMRRLEVDVELLNERLATARGIDTTKERAPWFHIDGPIFSYSSAGPADSEDYRVFARLYQAAIYAAVEQLEEAGLNDSVLGKGSNIEDIGFLYVITPFNAFGYRLGFQGGGGIMTSFSFNDQALLQRDSEYRHVPGVITPGGRMVGSGVFGMKGVLNPGNSNSISPNSSIALHELTHGIGTFDDYSYGRMGANIGEAAASGVGNWGGMGDPPVWRKFRQGWIEDNEIKVILPGESIEVALRALGSYDGDGGTYTDDPSIKTRMILIPKEYRTRDTFGIVWNNGWNPFKENYNWYDWFTNVYVGGETYSLKSFPTFYTLESRKALGADGNPIGRYTGTPPSRQGVVVSYVANPTWETGHGAGGFKIMTGNSGLKEGATWSDPNIGLTVKVLENAAFYDKVQINYTGVATNGAKHVYQGLLKASDNYVTAGQDFTIDFNLTTLGTPAPNDDTAISSAVQRVATPLGVSGGVSGFAMEVAFDANVLEYVSAGSAPFACTVDTANAAAGALLVKAAASRMIDKDTILSLNFKTKASAVAGEHIISGKITDVALLNWRGEKLVKGDPGFEGVGTFGDGTLAALYNAAASNTLAHEDIRSTGGKVTIGTVATYTVTGSIVCDTPGPAPGSWIGIESTVTLFNSSGAAVAKTKSDWDGNFTIKGVPAGSGYYISAEKSKYAKGASPAFGVAGPTTVSELRLDRKTYPVSGAIYGSPNSDGSKRAPLAGVDVYVVGIAKGYQVLGGPVKTDKNGNYTVHATTDTTERNYAGIAVKVDGAAAKYGTQLTLFAKDDLTGKQVGNLDLNMGKSPHIISEDYIYPENTQKVGIEGTFAFHLGGANSQIVTDRDVTLTETQDVHIGTITRSTDIYYQLRSYPEGEPVGARVRSVGTANGDDLIRNVKKGMYYIEVTREGYVTLNTMPFKVDTTRLLLRDDPTRTDIRGNTMDMNTRLGANVVAGRVIDETGKALKGVSVVFESWSNDGGRGNPVFTDENGEFTYDVIGGDKDLIFSLDGYKTQAVNLSSDGVVRLANDIVMHNQST